MAEPGEVQIRGLRLRVDRRIVREMTDAELQRRIARQLPASIDAATARTVSVEVGRAVRGATRDIRKVSS